MTDDELDARLRDVVTPAAADERLVAGIERLGRPAPARGAPRGWIVALCLAALTAAAADLRPPPPPPPPRAPRALPPVLPAPDARRDTQTDPRRDARGSWERDEDRLF